MTLAVDDYKPPQPQKAKLICSVRLALCILVFFATTILYAQRATIGLAIICMVNHTAVDELKMIENKNIMNETLNKDISSFNVSLSIIDNLKDDETQCYAVQIKTEKKKARDGPLILSKHEQGLILSSFFYGYILTQVSFYLLLLF
jgi:MFS transporter, ACS family, solute carrier family 17 (sodium-dependent inorganic phosphate cotransporter), member 5